MLAPRIAAAADNEVAGLIIMAGAVRSLEQSLVDQTRYLALADGTISPDEQRQIDEFVQLVARVEALSRPDVTFKLYPSLNHAFIAGAGKSLPGEYSQPGHVASDVLSDIGAWVSARQPLD